LMGTVINNSILIADESNRLMSVSLGTSRAEIAV
jgi:hypothetical protein